MAVTVTVVFASPGAGVLLRLIPEEMGGGRCFSSHVVTCSL